MSDFDWLLYVLVLAFKVTFSMAIPLAYIRVKRLD